jgi:hypothetical protein
MAKKFLTSITLLNLASDPVSGSEGDIYFNTTTKEIKIYADGSWKSLSGGAESDALSPFLLAGL